MTKLTVTLEMEWHDPEGKLEDEDIRQEVRGLLADYLAVHRGKGESTLAADYGTEAWGGYDGVLVAESRVTHVEVTS